jgi:stress response protein YsnF
MYGTRYDGPPIPPPSAQRPIRIVLHEEVPEVSLRLTPYELVTVTTGLLAGEVEVHEQRHREQLDLEHDNHPAN